MEILTKVTLLKTDTIEGTSDVQSQPALFLGSGRASYLALHIDTLRNIFLPLEAEV